MFFWHQNVAPHTSLDRLFMSMVAIQVTARLDKTLCFPWPETETAHFLSTVKNKKHPIKCMIVKKFEIRMIVFKNTVFLAPCSLWTCWRGTTNSNLGLSQSEAGLEIVLWTTSKKGGQLALQEIKSRIIESRVIFQKKISSMEDGQKISDPITSSSYEVVRIMGFRSVNHTPERG